MGSSILQSPNFKYQDGNLQKKHESMDYYCHRRDYRNHQQPQTHNLMRFRSAPGAFLESHLNGGGDEDFGYFRSSSPEMENILTRFMNSSGEYPHEYRDRSMKQEVTDSPNRQEIVFESPPVDSLRNESKMDCSYAVMSSMMENSLQSKIGSGNENNLLRQNSSPSRLFSNTGNDNGFSIARDSMNFGKGEVGRTPSRLNKSTNFTPGISSPRLMIMPQIAEAGDVDFTNPHWEDNSFNSLKRFRENEAKVLSSLHPLESQTCNGLTHHLSLPKTSAEMEKLFNFQGSVPCKIRAKRGCATHPRSIAERMRRTRISERMRKLQELFPDMDKQTNTADMLELAVEHIKDLQKQVKMLTDTKAKCKCSSKEIQYSNASV